MIVPLVKATICGLLKEKERALARLQDLGWLHLIPLRLEEEKDEASRPSPQAREALEFLWSCPQRRRQVRDHAGFDAALVERRALELRNQIQTLQDERDFLNARIAELKPWGDFVLPAQGEMKNLRFWFYLVPHNAMKAVRSTDLVWQVVRRDHRFSYVVVVSAEEPQGMPVARTHTGSKSLSELENRLEHVEIEIEDLQAERASLTRWCDLFSSGLGYLEDLAALIRAAHQTFDQKPLFALQAWAPREKAEELRTLAHEMQLVLEVAEPTPEDAPPTLFHNPSALAGGEDLVSFYMTPSYWLWDPSISVFFAFALFFAMILSDAGYALLLGLGLLLLWKRMGRADFGRRLRALFLAIVIASAVWGILIGSYFGVAPPKGGFLARLKVLDLNDFSTMMRLSILVGVAHLVLANAATAWRFRHSMRVVAPIGWIFVFLGAVSVWTAGMGKTGTDLPSGLSPFFRTCGFGAMGVGGAAVALFSEVEGPLWRRLLGGLHELTRLSGAFGDSLSYLRLFALGLAGGSLAVTFNQLAGEIRSKAPGIGLLCAALFLILGHGMNLLLGVSSGVIHGLRLNFIEFFNWSMSREGPQFQPFSRRANGPRER